MSKLYLAPIAFIVALVLAPSAQAQTYTGEAVFPVVDYEETFFPVDPDTHVQIEVTCFGTSSVSWSNMEVDLTAPSMSLDWNSQRTSVTGNDDRFCVDTNTSFRFSPGFVTVTDSGVIGQNTSGSLTVDLLFSADRSLLEGTVTIPSVVALPGQEFGQASLSLPSAEKLLSDLVAVVLDLNLKGGISNALDSKLQNVLAAIDRAKSGDNASAIGILYSFIQSVEAQRGKEIPEADADQLVSIAQGVIDVLT